MDFLNIFLIDANYWLPIYEGKSLLHPNLWGLEHITPQPMKMDFLPPELSKMGQITP
jgi:hypothetical protein